MDSEKQTKRYPHRGLAILLFIIFVAVVTLPLTTSRFKKQHRMDQAKANLTKIFQSQLAHKEVHGSYAIGLGELGFEPESETLYKYYVVQASSTSFLARAKGNIDGDPHEDIWQITENGILEHFQDDLSP